MSTVAPVPVVAVTRPFKNRLRTVAWLLLLPLGALLGAIAARSLAPSTIPAPEAKKAGPENDHLTLAFARDRWEAAGVKVEAVSASPLADYAWRTGRVVVNEDRIAHISPPVEGIIREVRVSLGQDVEAGQVLAVLSSERVSQLKLDLVTARVALSAEREREKWARQSAANTEALVAALRAGKSVEEIDTAFKDRPVGTSRQLLMSNYTGRNQFKAQLDSIQASGGGVSGLIQRRAQTEYESSEASLQAMLEETKYQSRQQARQAELRLREAEAAFDVARIRLLTLGYTPAQIETLDPVKEGAQASMYEVKAAFAGTVVEKHAVRSERVVAPFQLFQIADLSEIWVQADAFEGDFPLLQAMRDRSISERRVAFRAPSAGISDRMATLFYSGDLVDRTSRTLTVTAMAPNADRALKPGMYVEVGLPRGSNEPVIHVPASSIQHHQGKPFVFVFNGKEEFRRVEVELGREAGERVEIKSGIKAGAEVATTGGFVLKSELFRDQLAGD